MSSRSSTSGHGGGGNGSSGRSRHKKNLAIRHKPQTNIKFHGACEALKDKIFDCSDYKQADTYATTIKRVAEYVGSQYKNGGDVRATILTESKFNIPRPIAPVVANARNPTPEEQVENRLYERCLDALIKREAQLDSNIQCLYSLVIGQSTDLLQTKLRQQATWDTIETNQDGIALLALIKQVVHRFKHQKYLPLALYNAKLNLYQFRQGNLTNSDYLQKFNNLIDVATLYKGQLHNDAIRDVTVRKLFGDAAVWAGITDDQKKAATKRAHEIYCAMMFLAQCDKWRYGRLLKDLENNYT